MQLEFDLAALLKFKNYEYGIVLHEKRNLVGNLAIDMQRYFNRGNIFEREKIAEIRKEAEHIKSLRREAENTPQARETRKILAQKSEVLQTVTLWKHQVRNAQLTLKLQGKTALFNGKWSLLKRGRGA